MNPYIGKLLANIPGGLPVGQDTTPALSIEGLTSISLIGSTLYLSIEGQSKAFDLLGLSVGQLAQQINQFTTATVIQDGIVELLSLPDDANFVNELTPIAPGMWAYFSATLYLPTDETYFTLGMQARLLETNRRYRSAEAAQVSLQAAYGACADWWGASTNIPRYQGEPDVLYVQRIAAMRFGATQNDKAIELLFAKLGYQASVVYVAPGQFSVQVSAPTSPPQGFAYTLAQMADILSRIKSAGYQGTIYVQAALQDTTHMTDSLSVTLQAKGWTVGNVTVGKFTV